MKKTWAKEQKELLVQLQLQLHNFQILHAVGFIVISDIIQAF
jgi:hypothetical protein